MVAAELRYLGSLLTIVAVLIFCGALASKIQDDAHLSIGVGAGIFLLLLCIAGFSWLICFVAPAGTTSNVDAATSSPRGGANPGAEKKSARYAPRVLFAAVVLINVYFAAASIPNLVTSHGKHGLDSFALSSLSTALFLFTTIGKWRRRRNYRDGAEPPLPASAARRLDRLAAAHALPTPEERSAALRPLRTRGLIRLALLILMPILIFSLAPSIGTLPAFFGSLAAVALTFLILHLFFDV